MCLTNIAMNKKFAKKKEQLSAVPFLFQSFISSISLYLFAILCGFTLHYNYQLQLDNKVGIWTLIYSYYILKLSINLLSFSAIIV